MRKKQMNRLQAHNFVYYNFDVFRLDVMGWMTTPRRPNVAPEFRDCAQLFQIIYTRAIVQIITNTV